MDNTIQLYVDKKKEIKGYPITSPDRVIDENGVNIKDEIEEINSSLDNIAHQVNEGNLEDLKKYKNIIFEANTVINSDVAIELKDDSVINFNNCTINGLLKINRNKNTLFKGKVKVNGDVYVIGSIGNNFEFIDCELFYLQNYVGWGGVYWNTWDFIKCKAVQVRQAIVPNSTSAINSNRINKLVAQGGLERNNWINVWFRKNDGGFIITEEGTHPNLVGVNKWDIATCNPFEINNIDASYSNSSGDITSYGVVCESNRPIYLNNGFIENVDIAISGKIECKNIELRNTNLDPISGDYDFKTSKLVGKIGGFNHWHKPVIKNCEFGEGLNGFTKNGDVEIVKTNTTDSKYGRVCRITQNNSNVSKLMYEFVAERDGTITIAVRGVNIGQITCANGETGQYSLGNIKPNGKYGYSIGRAEVTKGNKILITVYTPAYTTLGAGEVTDITGIQVFYGRECSNIFDETTYSSLPTYSSNTQYDWKTGFTLDYIKGGITEIEFKVAGNIVGQGDIKGIYKGIINIDEELTVTDNLKSFVYAKGGKSSFDIQFVLNGDKIECQFTKGYYGTGCVANFIDIKVNELFVVNVIN